MAKWVPNKDNIRAEAVGDAYPEVEKIIDQVYNLAQRYVPVRTGRPYDKRATGRLKRSMKKRGPFRKLTVVSGSVGTTMRYSDAVHNGAKAHPINPRFKPELVFYWQKRGVTFVGDHVNHPGIGRVSRRQYMYLPLVIIGRKHGFQVRRLTGTAAAELP